MASGSGPNRIDPTPVRISTNLSVDRQTPKTDFGERVKVGIDNTTGTVASGAATAAPYIPGGAIVSAAVSSVNQMSHGTSSGQAVTSQYMMGVTPVGGGSPGTVATTVGGPSSVVAGGGSPAYAVGSAAAGGTAGQMSADIANAQVEQGRLLQLQIAMQRESQIFSTVSNVLKVRHDTVKNTISNVR